MRLPALVLRLLLVLLAASRPLGYLSPASGGPAFGAKSLTVARHQQQRQRGGRPRAIEITMAATQPIKDLTLLFVRRVNTQGAKEILLGLKKRGFGKGKWNGFGGKVEKGETIAEAAMRELLEEACLKTESVVQKGELIFKLKTEPEILRVHVFQAGPVVGTPQETDEMKPQWFSEDAVPYDLMWADDKYWLPLYLQDKCFKGDFHFSDESTIIDYELKEVEAFNQ